MADGIGAGFVFDGRLFTGAHGFSGELAHVQVAPEGPVCFCGNRGCLIAQTAVRGLRDRHSAADMAELGSYVGRALAPLITMLDPDCVVVDARLAEGCGPFIAGVTAQVERKCPPDLARTVTVVAGELADAERYGALAAADAHAASLVSETAWPALPPAEIQHQAVEPALFMRDQRINKAGCGDAFLRYQRRIIDRKIFR